MRNMRVMERLFNRPLMISEPKLNVILSILGPRFNLDLTGLPKIEQAVASDEERRRAGYSVVNGVAMIGIYGPLMHRVLASEFPSGGPTSYSEIQRSFDMAMADDGVREIILDIDSPGGESCGVFDLADSIYLGRSTKPSTAMINEQAYSAGYLLASSASRIVIPRTGGSGSIGVIATCADFSRAEDAAGITVTHVFAGARKADFSPHQPLSPEAHAVLQEMVNDNYEMFVDAVARNRGMSTKSVRETEAGLFEGKKAVAAKLADEVSAVNKAVLAIQKGTSKKSAVSMAGPREKKFMNVTELRESHPDLVAQIEAEARQGMTTQTAADTAMSAAVATAATEERGRMMGLISATLGEEVGTRLGAIAAKGLTGDDVKDLGISLSVDATGNAADEASRQAILKGLHAVAPEGVKGAKVETAAEVERSAAVSKIAAGGNRR